jgi:flavin-dependent dehydrogenase
VGGFDFVVVGGGIAGGAFATVMSRAGASVLMLERQTDYRDRVRGELMWPWGVAEVQRLGLDDVLLGAGANVADRFVGHDEGEPAVRAGLSGEVIGAAG